MTDMYDKPKNYEGGKMKPYPHFEMPAFSVRRRCRHLEHSSVEDALIPYFSVPDSLYSCREEQRILWRICKRRNKELENVKWRMKRSSCSAKK